MRQGRKREESVGDLAARVEACPPEDLPALIRRLERDPRRAARQLAGRARRRLERWEAACRRWEAMSATERALRETGLHWIAGVDEAGRGPLAGPVVAAAVILPAGAWIPGLDDSKRLPAAERERLAAEVRRQASAWAVGVATAAEVDALNVWHATRLAMRRALDALPVRPELVLVDGRPVPELGYPQRAVVDGDATCVSIAAASVVAKVFRDRLMTVLDAAYPQYGFAVHKGYATAAHREALRRYGPCPEHRLSFLGEGGERDPAAGGEGTGQGSAEQGGIAAGRR